MGGRVHAFRWTTSGPLEDITPPGFSGAVATDVDDAGYVAGYGWITGAEFETQALRWAPGTGNRAVILDKGTATVINNGDALGMDELSTTTRLWPLKGPTSQLPGPQMSYINGLSGAGRLVGYTTANNPNPNMPWAWFNGGTTWLPVPDPTQSRVITQLHVNSCGSIVARQRLADDSVRGLLYSKTFCDTGGNHQ